jgi:hypothetical protein
MNDELRADYGAAPHLFYWREPIPLSALQQWVHESRLLVPDALLDLWHWSGGGDWFDTETILRPEIDGADGDGVETMNQFLQSQGLSDQYLVFNTGAFLSAVRQSDGHIIWLGEANGYRERLDFGSLEEWYTQLVRAEYAEVYGLADAGL